MIVLFAHWCPKCSMMMPIVDEIEEFYQDKLEIIRIDVEKEPQRMEEYGVKLVPTFLFYRNEKEIARMAGLIGEQILYRRIEELYQ